MFSFFGQYDGSAEELTTLFESSNPLGQTILLALAGSLNEPAPKEEEPEMDFDVSFGAKKSSLEYF